MRLAGEVYDNAGFFSFQDSPDAMNARRDRIVLKIATALDAAGVERAITDFEEIVRLWRLGEREPAICLVNRALTALCGDKT